MEISLVNYVDKRLGLTSFETKRDNALNMDWRKDFLNNKFKLIFEIVTLRTTGTILDILLNNLLGWQFSLIVINFPNEI